MLSKWLIASLAVMVCAPITRAVDPGVTSITVPEGFMVQDAVKPGLIAYPMFGNFDHQGRLYIAESSGKDVRGAAMAQNPECRIRMLEDTDADGVFDSSTVFADKVGIPMGVLHHQGSVYVASPPEFLRFTDTNNDGIADRREVILSGWNVRGTASLHGPFVGPDGWLYLTDGRHGYDITTREGTQLKGLASRIWKCRPDGTGLDWFAGGGFDNPIEIVFTESGEMIGTMTYFTNPQHGQRDALMHFIRGGVYSKDHASVSEFKRTGDLLGPLTRFARVAPAGLHRYTGTQFGAGFHGNLFSAHFNPHRVLRHVLTQTNASYVSSDSDFLISEHPDFHPTDLVEDADGSLLVIDTGGWYVDQCPLSRISKPEFRGGIYRVSRIGVPTLQYPRGEDIDWSKLADPASLLNDSRSAVRARARELAVAAGDRSVRTLKPILTSRAKVEHRCDALWTLHQIGTPAARALISSSLTDPQIEIRIAAANSVGLSKDTSAAGTLHTLLTNDEPIVRRAVAAALGQIGAVQSNGALIKAAEKSTSPFEDHAIICALIENYSRMTNSNIKHSAPQLKRLPAGSARAALLAFDQMDNSQLEARHVLPLLDYPDERVQATAAWVFTQHKEWSAEAIEYLKKKLFTFNLEQNELDGMKALMRTYNHSPDVQGIMARAYASNSIAFVRKLAIMEEIHATDLPKFPGRWLNPLKSGLISTNETMRELAFEVIESRNILGFDNALSKIAESDPREDLRYRAYAIMARQESLGAEQIDKLISDLSADGARQRSGAAGVLSTAKLTSRNRITIAKDHLHKADAMTMPSLLKTFTGQTNANVGHAFVEALMKSRRLWPLTNPRIVERALDTFPDIVKSQGIILLGRIENAHADSVAQLAALAPLLESGDVSNGRRVFFGEKSQCATCHAVGMEGGTLGPDLTAIGRVRSGLDILEAIIFPSASFVPGYEPMKIVTANDIQSGIIVGESRDHVTLKIHAQTEMKFKRAAIKSVRAGDVSTMPTGLDKALSKTELADLLAYLQSLNGEKWLQPDRLGNSRKPALSPAERAAR